jgi:hypothetical protein
MKLFVFPYLVLEADLLVRRWTTSQENSPFFLEPDVSLLCTAVRLKLPLQLTHIKRQHLLILQED